MLDLIPLILFVIFLIFIAAEQFFPGRTLARVKGWYWKGAVFFVISFLIGGLLPEVWIGALSAHHVADLSALGTWGGALVAVLVAEFVAYCWHRMQHNVPFVWRFVGHQMHHSAERVDAAGAFLFHPLDSAIFAFMTSAPGALLGVTPEAAGVAGMIGFSLAVFQHANIRTPHWLGYLVQRPEAHAIHHQRGVHAFNYGNIALFDQLFGTYRNPEHYGDELVGFWDGASSKVGAMLVGKDVSAPEERKSRPSGERGVVTA
jgi:sterol desaturase/sphingolipid hydroxylase (fatty acid hydroxylase superfamily)